ncbi:universal stress protein [Sphingosinicella rhizophila]|uniref:Universal stress protein n=1 Tax=Sphingosinicella rhizophila TaxID=3050082 RepID=A0ABU3QBT7_9SPHN|nr:universal stress protein [Sphingosinicella sp. GR2756]MDT9600463.1 universal stress protein [Sphingosinicella sp. GR2756]
MKIIACIDASQYATSVVDHAAWVAARLHATVEVLHVIQRKDAVAARHDLSGAVGLGAKSGLMEELTLIDEADAKLAREQGNILLRAAGERLNEAGVRSELCHRHGGIVETVIEREADADLVVIGKRGASADFAKGHLGSKIERVVRQSAKPVLVASRTFRDIHRALIAFDGGPTSKKAVGFAATSPLLDKVELHLTIAGAETDRNRDSLRWAQEVLGERCVRAEIVPGDADGVLVAAAGQCRADLVITGAYGHSPIRTLIVGSTTTAILRGIALPVLLFR